MYKNKEDRNNYQKRWRANNPNYGKEWLKKKYDNDKNFRDNENKRKRDRRKESKVKEQERISSSIYRKSEKCLIGNWAGNLIRSIRRSAKIRNLKLDIDKEYILKLYKKQKGLCYWYKFKMEPSTISRYPLQPSIDRIDNKMGYTKDNVVLCCLMANLGRNVCDVETWKDILKKLKINEDIK
jgi:hypothetical protein